MKRNKKNRRINSGVLGVLKNLMEIQDKIKKLPELPPQERAKLEHGLAIDQLYYSSKIEGTHLTHKVIDKAIHGPELSSS